MLHHWGIFFIILFLSLGLSAQDERYYRQILTGELPDLIKDFEDSPIPQFNVMGPLYKIDLNGDGVEESLQPQKRDGVDWLVIRDSSQRVLFEAKLLAMGGQSVLYKIKLVNISPKVKTLILFLDEGITAGKKFESTARIFLLSFENNNLNSFTLTQGPHFFQEKESQRHQYWRRNYMVNIYDIDGDGKREIAVQFNHIQRIMKYMGSGVWDRI